MKLNGILLLILIGLLSIAYIFEEKGAIDQKELKEKELSLIKKDEFDKLLSVKFPLYEIQYNKEATLISSKHPADQKKLNELMGHLSRLRLTRILEKEEVKELGQSSYVPDQKSWVEFNFSNGKLKLILGKKLDYSTEFYMQVVKNDQLPGDIVVVEDARAEDAVLKRESAHRSDIKYRRLQSLLWIPEKFLFDRHLILDSKFSVQEISSIKIENKKKIAFEIKLSPLQLLPKTLTSYQLEEKRVQDFLDEIIAFEGEEVLLALDSDDLSSLLTTITLTSKDGVKTHLDFYRSYKSQLGSYAHIRGAKHALKLTSEQDDLFYTSYQRFMNKAIIDKKELKSLSFSDFSVSFQKDGLFKATSPKKDLAQVEFKKLYDLLVSEASYYTPLLKDESYQEKLDFSLLGEKLTLAKRKNELLLLIHEKGLKLHYDMAKTYWPSVKFADYLR
ncbi:hypothetical protein HBN50_00620 [Halobacteriovorax sp. GB3]|uniref:hypothetical protein n=1 Tax=Halobacteriovorax sp. GB3 TaxID=2719615 RepID=UPI00235E0852|nr:hypothetical protein [Halobacteriovorax sp. GB3]MDD0851569.1 hypothetical protein [Halobacteriovorax sp. GB3]